MAFNFNAEEIFRIAEQIEKNGADFYKKASEKISDSHFKKLLADLSSMETEHLKIFTTMHSLLTEKEKEPTVFDPMDESLLYLKSLADMEVFYKKELDFSSMKTILMTAIDMEKDSIVFYAGMKDLVPEQLGKDKLDNIIGEEKKHVRLLADQLKNFKK
ncbi:MAG: ferritin family protein [Spirochaetota bacterium]